MVSLQTPSDASQFASSLRAAYGAYDTEPTSSAARSAGTLTPVARGPFDGFLIHANAVRSRRPALRDRWEECAFILMPLEGDIHVDHYDRQNVLTAGDMVLMDSRAPSTIDAFGRNRSVVLAMPRSTVSQLRPNSDRLFGHRLQGRRGIGNMLSAMLASIVDADADDEMDACDSMLTLSVTMSLLDRLIENRPDADTHRRSRAEAEIRKMRSWVVDHAADPDMSIETLAHRFGLSRRSLYRLFGEVGTTPRQWLADVRLDEARAWLVGGDPRFRSVGQVAFAAGFNDSSHFTRLFKRRFGVLPGSLAR
ncbi:MULTISPECIES: helix-turn-helix domain-containing protein [unclassified Sphingomonas]|uniref:helix-turn-helix domain-containing protein n=1 Tax=unclassified Sphingomonas TaxID=196159 RepID=UPI0007013935|nr:MULTISPECIES: helix-turn-helix domain-containing protein [unclassified Sphingomonas]KQX25079.1 AraC family transcriptional regulator [Sphingomonas sp. Root1294]KQY66096.1 AraC family transcriptional regulator [Sphingomonas sp. Root50]KRB89740.1 AraC family transcriptional regulator [Sphingomonas sp. Root720]